MTYDVDGRPVSTSDSKGSQTVTYDPTSGLVTKLEDSAAGMFTATYDADGNLKTRALPDGLTATTTYNAVDEPISLAYTKETSCGESCTWLNETLERSIYGQIPTNTGNLVNDSYFYDKDGRLVEARNAYRRILHHEEVHLRPRFEPPLEGYEGAGRRRLRDVGRNRTEIQLRRSRSPDQSYV